MLGESNNDEDSPNLFGLTEEERRRHRQDSKQLSKPDFRKNRGVKPVGGSQGSKKQLIIVLAPIVVGLGILCLPVNAASCLTAVGRMLCESKSFEAAIRCCDLALGLNPASADAYSLRAEANDDRGLYDQAIADYSRAILMDPLRASPFFQRGAVYYEKHDYKNAIADLSSAIKAQPDNAVAYVRRGIAHARMGDYDAAISDYDRASKLDPANTEAMYNRAWALDLQYDQTMENGNTGAALNQAQHSKLSQRVTDLSQKLEGAKTDPQLYYERAMVCLKLRKWKEAIADFGSAISLNPKFTSAYVNRGFAYSSLRQFDPAISDYTAAIAVSPQNPSAYYRRGIAYDGNANYTKALADYLMASRLNPSGASKYAAAQAADARRLNIPTAAVVSLAVAPKPSVVPGHPSTNSAAPVSVQSGVAPHAVTSAVSVHVSSGGSTVALQAAPKSLSAAPKSNPAVSIVPGNLTVTPGPLADKRLLLLSRIEALKLKGTSVKPFMDLFNNLETEATKDSEDQLSKDLSYLADKLSEQEDLVKQAHMPGLIRVGAPSPPSSSGKTASGSRDKFSSLNAPFHNPDYDRRYQLLNDRFNDWNQQLMRMPHTPNDSPEDKKRYDDAKKKVRDMKSAWRQVALKARNQQSHAEALSDMETLERAGKPF
jgi:tetratricopeptide (TPR) repeat protein